MEVVRDITFWLSINGRADEFVNGLICSEDVLYFIIVSALFLTLTILRLQVIRQKTNWLTAWGRYIGVFAIAIFLGYLSSRPQLMCFYDATRTKARTLTPNSQEIISKLKGDLTITTYVNMLDRNVYYGLSSAVKDDMNRFRMYTRFKPEIKMKYVYYYDSINNPSLAIRYPGLSLREQMKRIAETVDFDTNKVKTPEEIRKIIDLSGEGNRFVRLLESGNGKKTFLRIYEDFNGAFPHESEISAAFKHLIMDLPLVGFVKGHGERDIKRESDRDYKHFSQDKPFRYALINQGFDITEVDLHQGIPSNVRILVIADPRRTLSTEETEVLNSYISQGGNLFIAGEPKQQAIMNPLVEQFGVQFMPGCLVKPTENFAADLITSNPTDRATALSYIFEGMQQMGNTISMPGATGLTYSTDKGFTVTPLFTSDSTGSWNELQTTDFVEDTAQLNPELGEIERSYVTSVALSRKVGEKEQRIIIISDADCISNTEIEMMRRGINARNYSFVRGAFSWLSYEEAPIDVRRLIPPDNKVYIEKRGMKITKTRHGGRTSRFTSCPCPPYLG